MQRTCQLLAYEQGQGANTAWTCRKGIGNSVAITVTSSLCDHQEKIREHGVVMPSWYESQGRPSPSSVWKANSESLGCSTATEKRTWEREGGRGLVEKGGP